MSFDPTDRSALPFLDVLEAAAETFRAEALGLPDDAYVPLPDAETHTRGRWEVCLLRLDLYADDFPQAILEDNRARCPQTWALLKDQPGLIIAGFMRLTPGSVVLPHRDHRDDDVVRVHVGLQIPEPERDRWPEGTARLMDIRQLHEVKNPSDRDRLTLCCDFRLGVTVPDGAIPPWNPELVDPQATETATEAG